MDDLEGEQESALAQLRVSYRQGARRGPGRQKEAAPEDFEKIAVAAEHQRLVLDLDSERHADAVTHIFLEPGAAGEALAGVDDLRKASAARIEARPDLAAGRHVLGEGHDAWHVGVARGRQRCADEPQRLCEEPAGTAQMRLQNRAHIDGGRAGGEPLGEATPDREWELVPIGLAQEGAEAQIAESRAITAAIAALHRSFIRSHARPR